MEPGQSTGDILQYKLEGDTPMLALETTASIANHRLVIEDAALPDHAAQARVIVLWESAKPTGRRLPPPELAGMGEEKGDILNGPPECDWKALA
jgi:hypothetical protein